MAASAGGGAGSVGGGVGAGGGGNGRSPCVLKFWAGADMAVCIRAVDVAAQMRDGQQQRWAAAGGGAGGRTVPPRLTAFAVTLDASQVRSHIYVWRRGLGSACSLCLRLVAFVFVCWLICLRYVLCAGSFLFLFFGLEGTRGGGCEQASVEYCLLSLLAKGDI